MNDISLTESAQGHLAAKLRSARQATGLTTRDVSDRLAALVPVSHSTIANYEKGKTNPTLPVLSALAQVYQRPVAWFMESSASRLSGVRYRSRKTKVSASDKARFEAEALRWLEAYIRLENRIGEPLRAELLAPRRKPGTPPDKFAAEVRQHLGLSATSPIESVVAVMERFGIRVIELEAPDGIDGFAARLGNQSVVVLNSKCSNDRMRLNESHEFFHELLEHCGTPAPANSADDEDDAFACGRYFLLPREELKRAFEPQSFVTLVKYKETYRLSLSAMVYAAEQDGFLSSSKARHLWIEFSKRGWRVKEPGFVRPDRATRFEQMLDGAINRGLLTWREASTISGIHEEQLQNRVKSAMGVDPLDSNASESKGGEPTFTGLRLAK